MIAIPLLVRHNVRESSSIGVYNTTRELLYALAINGALKNLDDSLKYDIEHFINLVDENPSELLRKLLIDGGIPESMEYGRSPHHFIFPEHRIKHTFIHHIINKIRGIFYDTTA